MDRVKTIRNVTLKIILQTWLVFQEDLFPYLIRVFFKVVIFVETGHKFAIKEVMRGIDRSQTQVRVIGSIGTTNKVVTWKRKIEVCINFIF